MDNRQRISPLMLYLSYTSGMDSKDGKEKVPCKFSLKNIFIKGQFSKI
jgi:hypothetical protein